MERFGSYGSSYNSSNSRNIMHNDVFLVSSYPRHIPLMETLYTCIVVLCNKVVALTLYLTVR